MSPRDLYLGSEFEKARERAVKLAENCTPLERRGIILGWQKLVKDNKALNPEWEAFLNIEDFMRKEGYEIFPEPAGVQQ